MYNSPCGTDSRPCMEGVQKQLVFALAFVVFKHTKDRFSWRQMNPVHDPCCQVCHDFLELLKPASRWTEPNLQQLSSQTLQFITMRCPPWPWSSHQMLFRATFSILSVQWCRYPT
mmetsp:Transcript_10202/g.62209  ORF Transcript_10202/g.62209 Transcript_10202/m.62209 type:complete len:115 (+) Transcript_10202:2888-3232(+)